jgi:hypothetical protein
MYYTIVFGTEDSPKPLHNSRNKCFVFTSELSAWTELSNVKSRVSCDVGFDVAETLRVIPVEITAG